MLTPESTSNIKSGHNLPNKGDGNFNLDFFNGRLAEPIVG
jgi:hypothetical protein